MDDARRSAYRASGSRRPAADCLNNHTAIARTQESPAGTFRPGIPVVVCPDHPRCGSEMSGARVLVRAAPGRKADGECSEPA